MPLSLSAFFTKHKGLKLRQSITDITRLFCLIIQQYLFCKCTKEAIYLSLLPSSLPFPSLTSCLPFFLRQGFV